MTTQETPAQNILINYYDGDLKVGQLTEDNPEYVVLKTYEGEDLESIDVYDALFKIRGL
jgi:hypothetical protein